MKPSALCGLFAISVVGRESERRLDCRVASAEAAKRNPEIAILLAIPRDES